MSHAARVVRGRCVRSGCVVRIKHKPLKHIRKVWRNYYIQYILYSHNVPRAGGGVLATTSNVVVVVLVVVVSRHAWRRGGVTGQPTKLEPNQSLLVRRSPTPSASPLAGVLNRTHFHSSLPPPSFPAKSCMGWPCPSAARSQPPRTTPSALSRSVPSAAATRPPPGGQAQGRTAWSAHRHPTPHPTATSSGFRIQHLPSLRRPGTPGERAPGIGRRSGRPRQAGGGRVCRPPVRHVLLAEARLTAA